MALWVFKHKETWTDLCFEKTVRLAYVTRFGRCCRRSWRTGQMGKWIVEGKVRTGSLKARGKQVAPEFWWWFSLGYWYAYGNNYRCLMGQWERAVVTGWAETMKALLYESVSSVWFIHVPPLPPSLPVFIEHPLNALGMSFMLGRKWQENGWFSSPHGSFKLMMVLSTHTQTCEYICNYRKW